MIRRKSSGRRRANASQYATKADVEEIHRIFEERRQWLQKLEDTCNIQFARIAQIQAELDQIRRAWMKPGRAATMKPNQKR